MHYCNSYTHLVQTVLFGRPTFSSLSLVSPRRLEAPVHWPPWIFCSYTTAALLPAIALMCRLATGREVRVWKICLKVFPRQATRGSKGTCGKLKTMDLLFKNQDVFFLTWRLMKLFFFVCCYYYILLFTTYFIHYFSYITCSFLCWCASKKLLV